MNKKTQKSLSEITFLEEVFLWVQKKLKQSELIQSECNSYTQEGKQEFIELWKEVVVLFLRIKKEVKRNKYRRFFIFINYNKLIIRRYVLILYFEYLTKILEIFSEHEKFIRVLLKDNVKYDYGKIAVYIYKPSFLSLINTPSIFLTFNRGTIYSELLPLSKKEKMSLWSKRILYTDYKNIYFYIRNKFIKILFIFSKYIGKIIAKTKFSTRKKGLIQRKNIKEYVKIGKPWDIFLTRWNWNASNISIPWFWKHMSMYIWNGEFIKKNFIWKNIEKLYNETEYVIDATGRGTGIESLNIHLKEKDYLWVSRTVFSDEKIKRSIQNSVNNIDKKYDYIFDFYSDNNLVCSELILKSYSKESKNDTEIAIQLEKIGFNLTYPPNNFVTEIFNNNSNIKPIFFLDSIEKTGENFINTMSEFEQSQKRSRFSFFLK